MTTSSGIAFCVLFAAAVSPLADPRAPAKNPAIESVLLYDDQRIMRMELDASSWELARSVASLTGLLSWLESAPPGSHYR